MSFDRIFDLNEETGGFIVIVITWILTLSTYVFASPYFTPLRNDLTLPDKCKDPSFKFFQLPSETFFVGRSGGISMGFTFEYPISRGDASILWRYFKAYTMGEENSHLLEKIQNDRELKRDYEILMRNFEEQDFDFQSEGEILEALAIEFLYQEFPENLYYITGGVQYHESYSPQTIGEIDLWVGRRDTCETVAIGEAKLGTRKTLNKAKEQLRRFESFLINHDASPFSGNYQPTTINRK